MSENSVRHIDTLREMEAHKRQYQIRCSHLELEHCEREGRITCTICSKSWVFVKETGYSETRRIYAAEKDDYLPMV
ncbi:MAG: hypothetical protein ABI347_03050 [Nitrososphaera sp.]